MWTMSWGSRNKISRRSQRQRMERVAAGQPGALPGKVDNRAPPLDTLPCPKEPQSGSVGALGRRKAPPSS